MKLELKHLAPYLPYRLKMMHYDNPKILNGGQGSSTNWIGITHSIHNQIKPILRPLLDCLDKDIHFSENDIVYIRLIIKGQTFHGSLSYQTIIWLCKNHYDFQNLIEKGLAININTLDK